MEKHTIPQIARRFTPRAVAGEVRVERRAEGEPPHIVGYGAVFYNEADPGTEFELWDGLVERIMPGAFDRAIAEDDVRSLFNHDTNYVLGRKVAGTLDLAVDEKGLLYDTTPPDTQAVRDLVLAPIGRGDVSGSSIMFVVREQVWREVDELTIREIVDVDLWEVGPVTFPAYEATSTNVRSADVEDVRGQLEAWQKARAAEIAGTARARRNRQMAARMAELGL